jgi:hypothetical protein
MANVDKYRELFSSAGKGTPEQIALYQQALSELSQVEG